MYIVHLLKTSKSICYFPVNQFAENLQIEIALIFKMSTVFSQAKTALAGGFAGIDESITKVTDHKGLS